jgi:aryl-alcohol dehydrogenase-like predicted oxidoreductase
MLSKVVLGTANFTQPYGILSEGIFIPKEEVLSILDSAAYNKIEFLDSALNYGDIYSIIPENYSKKFKIITKFKISDDFDEVLKKIRMYDKDSLYGILVHDSQNFPFANINILLDFFKSLCQDYGVKKIGFSVYDMQDIENFKHLFTPDIIQIPLNPLNQTFNNDSFRTYIKENEIEVHARSLFLQGVLLLKTLPKTLDPLKEIFLEFQKSTMVFPSCLDAILSWAFHKEWVNKWVIGVSSNEHIKQLINTIKKVDHMEAPDFDCFKEIQNSLIDPRNWANL